MTFVIFESHYKLLVDTINFNSTLHSGFGDIIFRCKDQLSSRNNFIVRYVRRQTNKVTYNIARVSLPNSNLHIFYDIFYDVLSPLYPILFDEINYSCIC